MARRKATHPSRLSNSSNRSSQQSNSTHASSGSLDFLGRPPTDTSESSTSSSPPVQQKRPRKQARTTQLSPAAQEIVKLQNTTHLLIPRLPFQRVIREILQKYGADLRLQSQAIEALRESSELYLVQMFSDAMLCMIHAKRVTLLNRDIRLLRALAEPREIL